MVCWIGACMKAKKEQVNDKLIVIKLFGSNYERYIFIHTKVQQENLIVKIKSCICDKYLKNIELI